MFILRLIGSKVKVVNPDAAKKKLQEKIKMYRFCIFYLINITRSQTVGPQIIDDGFCKYTKIEKMVPKESQRTLIGTRF